ncbi:MAG: hypothetical protein GC162_19915 [Planctomycetes bacterium]|nr:hypothetical protein [Planctomycetota bacterium]
MRIVDFSNSENQLYKIVLDIRQIAINDEVLEISKAIDNIVDNDQATIFDKITSAYIYLREAPVSSLTRLSSQLQYAIKKYLYQTTEYYRYRLANEKRDDGYNSIFPEELK